MRYLCMLIIEQKYFNPWQKSNARVTQYCVDYEKILVKNNNNQKPNILEIKTKI